MDYCEEMSTKVTKGLEFVSGPCPDRGKLIIGHKNHEIAYDV